MKIQYHLGRKALGILLMLSFFHSVSAKTTFQSLEIPTVPAKLQYCGMVLNLDAEARILIQERINLLHKTPSYFQTLLDRADTWMPFVENAFEMMRLPSDLKYIVILESALIGDAVSKSNAVGFWQFKEFTAREVGLVINDNIDERKHIFRSSMGAARYFHQLNRDFDNWVYSIIGYNQGPRGAIPFTEAKYYGQKEMRIQGNLHPYAIKAIAFKLAFEDHIGKNPSPKIWLEVKSTEGEISIGEIAMKHNLEIARFQSFNLWLKQQKLPPDYQVTYYIPHENSPPQEIAQEASLPKEIAVAPKPPKPPASLVVTQNKGEDKLKFRFLLIAPGEDPDEGLEYTWVKENETILEVESRTRVSSEKIRKFNDFGRYKSLSDHQFVRLKPLNKAQFHIVKQGETLNQIADLYHLPIERLKAKNNISALDQIIYPNQKLYLKTYKPKGEKPLMVDLPWEHKAENSNNTPKNQPQKSDSLTGQSENPGLSSENNPPKTIVIPSPPQYQTRWLTHTVGEGETLWQIYKKYNCPVDVIKKLNNLNSDALSPGKKLKIMARELVKN